MTTNYERIRKLLEEFGAYYIKFSYGDDQSGRVEFVMTTASGADEIFALEDVRFTLIHYRNENIDEDTNDDEASDFVLHHIFVFDYERIVEPANA
jgi:hypothetical protein